MTAPDFDRLRDALDTLAADVVQVDLRDRVYQTSRRLAMRRATAAGTCAAVLVGATVFTTARVFASAEGDAPPGTGQASASCVAADVRGPWVDPSDWATLTPAPSVDELFYLEKEPAQDTSVVRLVSWQPGMAEPVSRCELPSEAVRNANVSPDGRWVTWVSGHDGALHIADLRGRGQDRTLRRNIDGDTLAPVWSPDARKLVVRDVSAGADRGVVGVIDIASGRFTRLRHDLADARHLVWSADGTAIAFVTSDGAVVVAKPDGSQQRRVPNLDRLTDEGRQVVGVQSLSGPWEFDGSRWLTVTIGERRPAPFRSLVSNAMINTGDGRETGVAGGVGEYTDFQAYFRNEPGQGAMSHLLRRMRGTRPVELIGGNGEYWGGGDEPRALAGYLLLGA